VNDLVNVVDTAKNNFAVDVEVRQTTVLARAATPAIAN